MYVIHSENFSTTYHSKIYLLANTEKAWCAVGSNNLTGGGLWTNFESCSIQTYDLPDQGNELEPINTLMAKYTDSSYSCAVRINSLEDINTLLNANYISKEITQKMSTVNKRVAQTARRKKNPLFGTENIPIPTVISVPKPHRPFTRSKEPDTDFIVNPFPAFTNEQFWFEMRESTGGSRNILDLSKLGKIEAGSVVGTPYEYPDQRRMYGGIRFFDIDPEDISRTKNITINLSLIHI